MGRGMILHLKTYLLIEVNDFCSIFHRKDISGYVHTLYLSHIYPRNVFLITVCIAIMCETFMKLHTVRESGQVYCTKQNTSNKLQDFETFSQRSRHRSNHTQKIIPSVVAGHQFLQFCYISPDNGLFPITM